MIYKNRTRKQAARVLLLIMSYQLLYPNVSLALSTGPSQPEVQAFEPVGTTDMVDLFSGDFVYNIPLMDVEGYPVNISYHGGVNMEQEASWVGLGWNINVGEINHTVRGMPDDFKGDTIMKQVHINPECNIRVGAGVGIEPAGVGQPLVNLNANLNTNINISNYRGVSVDFGFGGGVNVFHTVSAGVNMGVGSQSGAGVDYNAGLSARTSQQMSEDASGGVGVTVSQGYNSRTGMKDRTFSWSVNGSVDGNNLRMLNGSAVVPIGTKNVIPVITNASVMNSIFGQVKLGGELFWCYGHVIVNANVSVLRYEEDGSRAGYGYLYPEKGGPKDIQDFTRDKDGNFNRNMQFLPPGNMTYDVYSLTGQGTGGSFRPFRNDFGSVYDPLTESRANNQSHEVEAGLGWNFSLGYDGTATQTEITSGPWTGSGFDRKFIGKKNGSIYESHYFKQAGELTAVDAGYFTQVNGTAPLTAGGMRALDSIKYKAAQQRDPRGNLISYMTAADASIPGVADQQKIYSYTGTNGFAGGPVVPRETIDRYESGGLKRRAHHISEVVQTQTDGRRYVYGIPAMNNVQKEVSFSITKPSDANDLAKGLVPYVKGQDDSKNNTYGKDNYYSATVTPSYAHSYLLTSVLSTDYTDVTGDGPTDDDFGTYTKFNYTRKEKDYRWRAPIENGKAQYNAGYWSDKYDDKANYLTGSREQWYVHSIESKNYIAEFYVSPRHDAKGVTDAVLDNGTGYNQAPYNQNLSAAGSSYELDSIKLYNKHERFLSKTAAVPVKTVIFTYDYSLCPGVPNVDIAPGTTGKLTLRRINVRYGNSDKSMISPYVFDYSNFNPGYNLACKDRWGGYKTNKPSFTNYEYPFTDQSSDSLDIYASAWSLTKIGLPSGGAIQVNYEADDYGYVQDRQAAEMFMVAGVGNGPGLQTGSQLYYDKKSPNLYVYFKRRKNAERPGAGIRDTYLKGISCLYYNFSTSLVDNFYEQVKGYASYDTTTGGSGVCPNNSDYAYVRLNVQHPDEGKANLNPVSYTAINFGRYHLPQIIFPGSDPDQSDLHNVLAGLKYAFGELVQMAKNPVIRMTEEGRAKNVNLSKSFVRLNSPGLKKKGGGQRVKSLLFFDSWASMAGGNAQDASYGKQYNYTKEDEVSGNGTISSGVASYEPQIGGDENPLRVPVPYLAQDGSRFPANDPVTLYQEAPVGESLYPSPSVGYSRVTVSSIHQSEGRSSQGIDIHEFYTARDFPVQVQSTGLDQLEKDEHYGFTHQRMIYKYAQGYTLTFNDMHGKPKRNEHRVIKPNNGATELISYQLFKYNTSGGRLNNSVPVLRFDPSDRKMKVASQQLGVEMDVTLDNRRKNEYTSNDAFYANLNTSTVWIFVIPIPLPIPWSGDYHNEYDFAVGTKVVQQYGIISQIESYQEGAVTTVRNEVFDPLTGQALITSVNNEFQDREYSVNYPAYWGYKSMGPAYRNIGYTDVIAKVPVSNYGATLPASDAYQSGDELLVSYSDKNGIRYTTTAFVSDRTVVRPEQRNCQPVIFPRFTYTTPGWTANDELSNVQITVIRSGYKNQLSESMESYTTMNNPCQGGELSDDLSGLIDIKAREYSNKNVALLPRLAAGSTASWFDSLNSYVNGRQEVYRVWKEYAYQKNRNYTGNTVRGMGLFDGPSLWKRIPTYNGNCLDGNNDLAYSYMKPSVLDPNWITARTVTMCSPYGMELENKDAAGNYSTAVYGYNNSLPVAVGQNAAYGELMSEGFEDYGLLQVMNAWSAYRYVPLIAPAVLTVLGAGTSLGVNIPTNSNSAPALVKNVAHTGYYSIKVPSGGYNLPLPYLGLQAGATGQPILQPFSLVGSRKYVVSYWIRAADITTNTTEYAGLPASAMTGNGQTFPLVKKSNVIDGWQQVEATFNTNTGGTLSLPLPAGYYVDDIRIYPVAANMKSYVYDPVNHKLMATLDENNFATLFEYDQEGNLIRTKKETERGIITVSESRSANPKK